MLRILIAFALLLAASWNCAFAAKRAFSIEDLYRIRQIQSVSLSPDGASVLFTLTARDLPKAKSATHIWTMGSDGANPRQLTYGEKGESSPAYSRDGRWIAFVSSRDGGANL